MEAGVAEEIGEGVSRGLMGAAKKRLRGSAHGLKPTRIGLAVMRN